MAFMSSGELTQVYEPPWIYDQLEINDFLSNSNPSNSSMDTDSQPISSQTTQPPPQPTPVPYFIGNPQSVPPLVPLTNHRVTPAIGYPSLPTIPNISPNFINFSAHPNPNSNINIVPTIPVSTPISILSPTLSPSNNTLTHGHSFHLHPPTPYGLSSTPTASASPATSVSSPTSYNTPGSPSFYDNTLCPQTPNLSNDNINGGSKQKKRKIDESLHIDVPILEGDVNLKDIFENLRRAPLEYHGLLTYIENHVHTQASELQSLQNTQALLANRSSNNSNSGSGQFYHNTSTQSVQPLLQPILPTTSSVADGSPSAQDFPPHLNSLKEFHSRFKKKLIDELGALNNLKQTELLSPHNRHKLSLLEKTIYSQAELLDLLENEAKAISTNGFHNHCLIKLVISDQPFPGIFMKRSKLGEQEIVNVTLLQASSIQLKSVSKIQINLLAHQPPRGKEKKKKEWVDQQSVPYDKTINGAKYHLTFLEGTSKNLAQVKFEASTTYCTYNGGINNANNAEYTFTLSSAPSKPFVVITNESQYADAIARLFDREVIGDKPSVAWTYFANEISLYFLKATRQDELRPERALSLQQLNSFHTHFFNGKEYISASESREFWKWYGAVLRQLRYQRTLLQLWNSRLIYGFISRDEMYQLIDQQKPGHFLLRFSESNPGCIAIGYKNPSPEVGEKPLKNYLVKPNTDITPKQSLADFLRSRAELSHVMQFTEKYLAPGIPEFRIIGKHSALKDFYSTTRTSLTVEGYD